MLDRLWQWLGLERRAVDYADPALQYLYGDRRTSAGEAVSLERAIGLTATWACVNLVAGSIASMPLVLYRRRDDGRERHVEHPLFGVLHERPNPAQSVVAFWEAMATALLLRGNAFALLTRDDDGRVRALWYVNPDRVLVDVTRAGKLRYKVTTGGSTQLVDAAGMLHVCGPMSDDGYTGRSVIGSPGRYGAARRRKRFVWKNSPSWSSISPREAFRMISMYSRMRVSGLPKCSPWRSWITSRPLVPRPRKNRPSDIRSRFSAVMAMLAGERAKTGTMLEPRRMREVTAASWASEVKASSPHDSPIVRQL